MGASGRCGVVLCSSRLANSYRFLLFSPPPSPSSISRPTATFLLSGSSDRRRRLIAVANAVDSSQTSTSTGKTIVSDEGFSFANVSLLYQKQVKLQSVLIALPNALKFFWFCQFAGLVWCDWSRRRHFASHVNIIGMALKLEFLCCVEWVGQHIRKMIVRSAELLFCLLHHQNLCWDDNEKLQFYPSGVFVVYAELKPVPCITYADAQTLRETCATPILKQGGGIARRNAPVLKMIREEVCF
ncbi:hypothetical protein ACLOJK_001242 [Asimina triloba]